MKLQHWFVLMLTAAVQWISPPPSLAQIRPPNILFIFTDDHAAHAISAYGSTRNVTPHLDRLAAEGILLENMFCGNAICAPSRATILTGVHTHISGQRTNQDTFDGSQPTLPKHLQSANYETAIIGKWHLKSTPTGFDHYEVLPGQGAYYNPDYIHHTEGRRRSTGYSTDLTTDKALDWLTKRNDTERPFLLMLQYKAPHRPWQPGPRELELFRDPVPAPPTLDDDHDGRSGVQRFADMSIAHDLEWGYDLAIDHPNDQQRVTYAQSLARMTDEQRATYEAAFADENAWYLQNEASLTETQRLRWRYQRYISNYLRCVAGVDRNIGRVLDHLEQLNLDDNTLVIYSSDQGFYLGEHGWFDKRWMYEESLRMPFIARWPGHIPAGTRSSQLTQNIDIAPTLLDAAGLPIPDRMQGLSILPVLKGQQKTGLRDAVYYHFFASEAWHHVPAHYGIRTRTHKLMYFYEHDQIELYDLSLDPDENHSVHNDPAYASTLSQLTTQLNGLRKHYADNEGEPFNPFKSPDLP
ncbi:sulfatase family protein [Mucisphaera sp.]|uniref:sulfatase family protein n=1 Tax=Mucisphaera sp. TaxID=2913024 RepID=UPI003D10107B